MGIQAKFRETGEKLVCIVKELLGLFPLFMHDRIPPPLKICMTRCKGSDNDHQVLSIQLTFLPYAHVFTSLEAFCLERSEYILFQRVSSAIADLNLVTFWHPDGALHNFIHRRLTPVFVVLPDTRIGARQKG